MIKIEAKLSGAKNKQEATFNSPNYPPCLGIKIVDISARIILTNNLGG